jgi:hypothetical protein
MAQNVIRRVQCSELQWQCHDSLSCGVACVPHRIHRGIDRHMSDDLGHDYVLYLSYFAAFATETSLVLMQAGL